LQKYSINIFCAFFFLNTSWRKLFTSQKKLIVIDLFHCKTVFTLTFLYLKNILSQHRKFVSCTDREWEEKNLIFTFWQIKSNIERWECKSLVSIRKHLQ
jgi:hypothetical protein